MKRSSVLITATLIGVGMGAIVLTQRNKDSKPVAKVETIAQEPVKLKEFVEEHKQSGQKSVQTQVTRARLHLAYAAAEAGNFTKAREAFLAAEKAHGGSTAMDPSFGSLSDQAAYQAIVCLFADGKKEQAAKEFRAFIKNRPYSPLIHACLRRLERIEGKITEADRALLESSVAKQEERIRFETSVCGPKVIQELLTILDGPTTDYKEIAKLARTTDLGTTVEGMRDALKKLGYASVAMEVNAPDFAKIKIPFIWLKADHYVLVKARQPDSFTLFDSRYGLTDQLPLPSTTDVSFRATVIALDVPDTVLTTEQPKSSTKPTADLAPETTK